MTRTAGTDGRPEAPRRGEERGQGDAPPFWEWVVAALGAVFLIGAVVYLVIEANGAGRQPPVLEAELREVVPQGALHAAIVRVHNRGRSAAAQVRVSGTVPHPGQEAERSDTEFDFVAGRSWREARLLFVQDPRGHLQLRVESYQPP